MSPSDSVTFWIRQLQAGDSAAAQHLWEGYFRRLVGLAQARLRGAPTAAAGPEDVALSAFHSFCRGVEAGRFPRLDDRDDLWQVLVMLTARKAVNLRKRESARKRGGGRVRQASALAADADEPDVLGEVVGREPSPEFAAQVAEECRRLLDLLGDDDLRRIALWKMEGFSNAEVAARLGRNEGTVERKLRLIRRAWEREVAP
jgi:DNA-directed RNA polymerase specialized sigma24 family protein